MNDFKVNIGIETHIELKTRTKAFCGCEHKFGADPNTHVCPVCMGLPGAIPSVNRVAVENTIKAGLLFHGDIQKEFYFERKNYFSPDLPKGYQIVQYSKPICSGGYVELSNGKKILLNRIHLEEATAKVTYDNNDGVSLIDYNRSGVAILEIVSNPNEMSSQEVVEYLDVVRDMVRSAGLSDCIKEDGQFRFDISISISKNNCMGTRVEINNLVSSKDIINAVDYEIDRQMSLLESGGEILQETRIWDSVGETTFTVRPKENVCDYRHIKDPDLKTICITDEDIARLSKELQYK